MDSHHLSCPSSCFQPTSTALPSIVPRPTSQFTFTGALLPRHCAFSRRRTTTNKEVSCLVAALRSSEQFVYRQWYRTRPRRTHPLSGHLTVQAHWLAPPARDAEHRSSQFDQKFSYLTTGRTPIYARYALSVVRHGTILGPQCRPERLLFVEQYSPAVTSSSPQTSYRSQHAGRRTSPGGRDASAADGWQKARL